MTGSHHNDAMRIPIKDYRLRTGEEVDLKQWPTVVDPVNKSKSHDEVILANHVETLSALQRLH